MLWLTRTRAPIIRTYWTHFNALHAAPRFYSADASNNNEIANPPESIKGTLRPRQHGNKSLPLSPLLSPERDQAKQRHKQPKPIPEDDALTDFQKELALNPHALALATPIRVCSLTFARLPRHFLLPFSTRVSHSPPPSQSSKSSSTTYPPKPTAHLQPLSYTHPSLKTTQTITTNSYAINRLDALQQVNRRTNWRALVTERMRQKFAVVARKSGKGILVKDWWVWKKKEVEALVRRELEGAVQRAVEEVLDFEGGRLVREVVGEEGACVLVLRSEEAEAEGEGLAQGNNQYVSTYDLVSLIPADNTGFAELLEKYPHRQLVVARQGLTVRMEMALSRLVAYLESTKLSENLAEKARIRDTFRAQKMLEKLGALEGR